MRLVGCSATTLRIPVVCRGQLRIQNYNFVVNFVLDDAVRCWNERRNYDYSHSVILLTVKTNPKIFNILICIRMRWHRVRGRDRRRWDRVCYKVTNCDYFRFVCTQYTIYLVFFLSAVSIPFSSFVKISSNLISCVFDAAHNAAAVAATHSSQMRIRECTCVCTRCDQWQRAHRRTGSMLIIFDFLNLETNAQA